MIFRHHPTCGEQLFNGIVIAADYRDAAEDTDEQQFVALTMQSRGRMTYTVWILEAVGEDDWKTLYTQTFRNIQTAVNGMTEPANKWDKNYDAPRPWLAGYSDCVGKHE